MALFGNIRRLGSFFFSPPLQSMFKDNGMNLKMREVSVKENAIFIGGMRW